MAIDIYDPNSPGTQMYVFASSTSGSRKVKVTATNSCGNYAEDFVFYLSSGMLQVYPNPAKDFVTLEFATAEIEETLPTQIQLFSESSVVPEKVILVKETLVKQNLENKISIEVGDLPRGTHYLHLLFGENKNERVEEMRIVLN